MSSWPLIAACGQGRLRRGKRVRSGSDEGTQIEGAHTKKGQPSGDCPNPSCNCRWSIHLLQQLQNLLWLLIGLSQHGSRALRQNLILGELDDFARHVHVSNLGFRRLHVLSAHC